MPIPIQKNLFLHIASLLSNHKGGCTRFGPDGYLYIGMGDGGSAGDPNNNAQNPMSLLGKMLRINVHSGVNLIKYLLTILLLIPQITGLRYGRSACAIHGVGVLMRLMEICWIADVGQENWEEVDMQLNGEGGNNYGWRCYEGKYAYNTDSCNQKIFYKFPIYQYDHSDSRDCSITGGFVYRGRPLSFFIWQIFFYRLLQRHIQGFV